MSTYDPRAYDLIIGNQLIGGFAEDTHITISDETPGFSDKVGVDGEVTRARSHDHRATMEVVLMASSESNEYLSRLYATDRAGVNGEGVITVTLVNRVGTDEYRASQAWIQKPPDVTLGKEVSDRTWEIRMADYAPFYGSLRD